MNKNLQAIAAVLLGIICGSLLNMGLITISGNFIAPPAGADTTTMEGLQASLPLFEPQHFIMPFLAHALGTFFGAFIAAAIAPKRKMKYAMGIGLVFLLGGLANIFMLPSPIWFNAVDVLFAYIPIAYMGGLLALKVKKQQTS